MESRMLWIFAKGFYMVSNAYSKAYIFFLIKTSLPWTSAHQTWPATTQIVQATVVFTCYQRPEYVSSLVSSWLNTCIVDLANWSIYIFIYQYLVDDDEMPLNRWLRLAHRLATVHCFNLPDRRIAWNWTIQKKKLPYTEKYRRRFCVLHVISYDLSWASTFAGLGGQLSKTSFTVC